MNSTTIDNIKIDRKLLTISVAKQIAQKRKKPITPEEVNYLKQRIKQINKKILANKKIEELLPALVSVYSQELDKLPKNTQYDELDIHSILVAELGKESESISGPKVVEKNATFDSLLQTPRLLQRIVNPQALKRKTYLLLDRKHQAKDANNITEFRWNVTDISHPYDSSMAVSTMPINDIVSIKMYPFIFPSALYTLNETKRLSVEIDELKNQAYVAPAYNKRFHFVFSVQNLTNDSNTQYNIDDLGNSDCVFDFHDPIIELNTITLRFGNPFYNLSLDPDQLPATITSSTNKALLTFAQPHNLDVNDIITISNFITSNANADSAQITLMNNKNGWPATITSDTTVTINVDLSGLVGTIINNPYMIYLESKRFVVRLEIVCVR